MSDEKEIPKQVSELSEKELDNVAGGSVNPYLIIDGRPGPSTSKSAAIAAVTPIAPTGSDS